MDLRETGRDDGSMLDAYSEFGDEFAGLMANELRERQRRALKPGKGHNGPPSPFTRIAASHIGRVLDNGKHSMSGVHLLAIKCSKGPGYVLNENAVRKIFGIGERRFRAGLALLRKQGVLLRGQPNHRSYAVETLVAVPADAYHVSIPDETLTADSAVVAFGLAVAISPTARKPVEVAKRIGIKSTVTTRKTMKAAEALGLVAIFLDETDAIRVSRPGEIPASATSKLGGVKNVGAKNVVAKNVGAHSTPKEVHSSKDARPQESESQYVSAHAEMPYLLSLRDWRTHPRIRDIAADGEPLGYVDPPNGETISGSEFGNLVSYFGGHCPRHLTTSFAVEQITSLASACISLASDQSETLRFADAIRGIAHQTAEAAKAGKIIRSLAFIALPILTASHGGNLDWAHEYPSPRLGTRQADYFIWARKLFDILQDGNVAVSNELLTTRRIEVLNDLLQEFSQETIEAAARDVTVEQGRAICGWNYLEQRCRQIVAESIAKSRTRQATGRRHGGAR